MLYLLIMNGTNFFSEQLCEEYQIMVIYLERIVITDQIGEKINI